MPRFSNLASSEDDDLRDRLRDLDSSIEQVTSWEAEFIEHIAFRDDVTLSDAQRAKAEEILERYGF